MMMATRNSGIETVRALFESGVDVFVDRGMIGRTALDMAHTLTTGQAIGVRDGETFEEVLERGQSIPSLFEAYVDVLENERSDMAF